MIAYGFTVKEYINDSLKAGDKGKIVRHRIGTENELRRYKKAARRNGKAEVEKILFDYAL